MQVDIFGVKGKLDALEYAIHNLRIQSMSEFHCTNPDSQIFAAIAQLCLIKETIENETVKKELQLESR